jgi:hypothetical protein
MLKMRKCKIYPFILLSSLFDNKLMRSTVMCVFVCVYRTRLNKSKLGCEVLTTICSLVNTFKYFGKFAVCFYSEDGGSKFLKILAPIY